jgi:PIN domain nuclease of toxin-antitoxin system
LSQNAHSVLDASALLAYLQGEEGAEPVARALRQRAWISAVNLSEVLAKLHERGRSPETVIADLRERGILDDLLQVQAMDLDLAIEVALLRPVTRDKGISLADRACLALGRISGLPVLTADRVWAEVDVGVEVRLIR